MKHLFIIFITLYSINAFAYYTETIPNQCGVIDNNLFAVFEVNSYTCQSGYFLPADTLGCVQCPSGYTCSGGTFDYNPTVSQGITYKRQFNESISNACASNFAHELVAVFEPNTVTITWDDGTNTIQNTCDYDGDVTIPPTPTRPGYVFSGWKVKSSNNGN